MEKVNFCAIIFKKGTADIILRKKKIESGKRV